MLLYVKSTYYIVIKSSFLSQNQNSDAVTSSDPAYPSRHGANVSGSSGASSSSQMVLPLQLSQPPIAVLFPSPVTADGKLAQQDF